MRKALNKFRKSIIPYLLTVGLVFTPLLQTSLTASAATLTTVNCSLSYAYTGGIQSFEVTRTGRYRLEVWGGQGGDGIDWWNNATIGGNGGYSIGEIELTKGDILYIGVGGRGGAGKPLWDKKDPDTDYEETLPIPDGYYYVAGGYNGGASTSTDWGRSGGGGGATHIALNANRGILSNYASYKSEILIVAGGGGGAGGGSAGNGYDGGGLVGGGPASVTTKFCEHKSCSYEVKCTGTVDGGGGTQTYGGYPGYQDDTDKEDNGTIEHGTPGGFGYGGNGNISSGAGGGWYGGGGGGGSDEHAKGGGGSGYLSSSLIAGTGSTMAGGATAGGNGKARITLVELTEISGGGGSNYVNTTDSISYESKSGVQSGNGKLVIQSAGIGFLDEMKLEGVAAPDLAAPESVQTEGVSGVTGEAAIKMEPVANSNGTMIKLTWSEPEDLGATYYHRVDSHMLPTGTKLCSSNIVENYLVTGVQGYYYGVDTEPETAISAENGMFTGKEKPYAYITLANVPQFLHIAPIDAAGNLGKTSHVPIAAGNYLEVPWPLYTNPIRIAEEENIYPSEMPNTWYVRADGTTAFALGFEAYLEGDATEGYQINQLIFESQMEGKEAAWNLIEVPFHEISEGSIETAADKLSFATEGQSVLKNYTYTKTIRSERNRRISVEHQFLLEAQHQGQLIRIIPRAAVISDSYQVYSDAGNDCLQGIHIIGDGTAPEIWGMESLEETALISRSKEPLKLTVTAEDLLSGVREFYVEIYNQDNGIRKHYEPDESGSITVDFLAEEPIFSGEFSVTVTAVDNVGNVATKTYHITEFALETQVTRILEPHEPIFQCGESGLLNIKTWGYVEKVVVEFPEELTVLNPQLNCTYTYEIPQYKKEEELQFMIPLYAPHGEDYKIIVRAYKGEQRLEDYPQINIIEVKGTILDEIRTRLR